jgi:holo-[acyl-carrier protein] synthase
MLDRTMTIGIGTDYVDVQELRVAAERQPDRYLRRIFTELEIAYAKTQSDPIQCLAGKLAAKEACMKAFGTGSTDEIDWLQIEILNDEASGRPSIRLQGGSAALAGALGVKRTFVSVSHTPVAATAVVLLEG